MLASRCAFHSGSLTAHHCARCGKTPCVCHEAVGGHCGCFRLLGRGWGVVAGQGSSAGSFCIRMYFLLLSQRRQFAILLVRVGRQASGHLAQTRHQLVARCEHSQATSLHRLVVAAGVACRVGGRTPQLGRPRLLAAVNRSVVVARGVQHLDQLRAACSNADKDYLNAMRHVVLAGYSRTSGLAVKGAGCGVVPESEGVETR